MKGVPVQMSERDTLRLLSVFISGDSCDIYMHYEYVDVTCDAQ